MSYSRPSCSRYQSPEKQWLQAEQGKYRGTRSLHSRSIPQPYTPLYKERPRNNYTLQHHQVSLMVLGNTTLVPSLGLRIGPACEAGLSAGMQKKRVPPQIRKKGRKEGRWSIKWSRTHGGCDQKRCEQNQSRQPLCTSKYLRENNAQKRTAWKRSPPA